MKINKRTLRNFGAYYQDMAWPRLYRVFTQSYPEAHTWPEFLKITKECATIDITWIGLFSIMGTIMDTHGMYNAPIGIWLLICTLLTALVLPVIQSPKKFLTYIWAYYIPDEEDEPEKQKGFMRLTDDGELEEVPWDEAPYGQKIKK